MQTILIVYDFCVRTEKEAKRVKFDFDSQQNQLMFYILGNFSWFRTYAKQSG